MSWEHPARGMSHAKCVQCGKSISKREAAENVAEYGGGIEMAAPFCCDACARARQANEQENIEEFEEVYRAGAT